MTPAEQAVLDAALALDDVDVQDFEAVTAVSEAFYAAVAVYRATQTPTCPECDGSGRVGCPGPSVEPKTQMGRDAAGLRPGIDYCYGMHMGHDCRACGGSGVTPNPQETAP